MTDILAENIGVEQIEKVLHALSDEQLGDMMGLIFDIAHKRETILFVYYGLRFNVTDPTAPAVIADHWAHNLRDASELLGNLDLLKSFICEQIHHLHEVNKEKRMKLSSLKGETK